jgi:hypothetical protein
MIYTQPLVQINHLLFVNLIYYLKYKHIYPRINLNSTFEEPGDLPVFHFILIYLYWYIPQNTSI